MIDDLQAQQGAIHKARCFGGRASPKVVRRCSIAIAEFNKGIEPLVHEQPLVGQVSYNETLQAQC